MKQYKQELTYEGSGDLVTSLQFLNITRSYLI